MRRSGQRWAITTDALSMGGKDVALYTQLGGLNPGVFSEYLIIISRLKISVQIEFKTSSAARVYLVTIKPMGCAVRVG